MDQVFNNDDLRREIWNYLRKRPYPLTGYAKYYEDIPDNPKLGDILETIKNNNIFIVFYGKNNKFVNNPGRRNNDPYPFEYLIIPIKITQYISNAVEYYQEITNDISNIIIELRWDDSYIINNYGELPIYWSYAINIDKNKLEIVFDSRRNIIAEFNINYHTRQDIIDFYNGALKKQTKIYMYFQYEGNIVRISLSNQLDDDPYNFFEFYVKKYTYNKRSLSIVNTWYNDTKIDSVSTYLPNTWRSYFIRGINNPYDNYFCIEYKGPLDNRQEVLQKLKKRFDKLGEMTNNEF